MTVLAEQAEQGHQTETAAALPTATDTPLRATRVIPTIQASGKFVASSEAKKYYYCFGDEAWKELSAANLLWSDDESVFTKRGLVLHEPCQ